MAVSIKHRNEPKGNAIRRRLDKVVGLGQRTYTPSQLVITKAKGAWLWTVDGRKLIDFTSGVLVVNLGHAHPGFERLYRKHAAGLPRNAYNMFTPLEIRAAERLIESLNSPKLQRVIWAASGSEGVIKAIWCAQHRYPDRPIMLATRGGFHGKKGLAGDVTGESSPNPNVRFISYPMCDYCDGVDPKDKGKEEEERNRYDIPQSSEKNGRHIFQSNLYDREGGSPHDGCGYCQCDYLYFFHQTVTPMVILTLLAAQEIIIYPKGI